MVEIFGSNVHAFPCPDEGAEGVLIVAGKTWEGDDFKLYLTRDEALSVMVQLGFYIDDEEDHEF